MTTNEKIGFIHEKLENTANHPFYYSVTLYIENITEFNKRSLI